MLSDDFLGIEVRDALAAHIASENVLVCINQGIDASFTHFVDQCLNFIKVFGIVLASFALYALPHDAKAHEVHAPLLQVCDILIVQRVLSIKVTLRWDVGINLIDGIDTMEKSGATIAIDQEARLWIHV